MAAPIRKNFFSLYSWITAKQLSIRSLDIVFRNIKCFSSFTSSCQHKKYTNPSKNNCVIQSLLSPVHFRCVNARQLSAHRSSTSAFSTGCMKHGSRLGNTQERATGQGIRENTSSGGFGLLKKRHCCSGSGHSRFGFYNASNTPNWLNYSLGNRTFHTSTVYQNSREPDDPDFKPPWREKQARFRLSNWREIIWPSLIKTVKNWILTILIRGYMDETYSTKGFLDGAEQAIIMVSEMLSGGDFQNLSEMQMVADEALGDAQVHYADLNASQRQLIKIDPDDLFFRYIYEIGMIIDDVTEKRFVEITTVFQGCQGLAEAKKSDPWGVQKFIADNADQLYICNYRFIREFTKGIDDDWVINKLNHFLPKELVDETPPFSR